MNRGDATQSDATMSVQKLAAISFLGPRRGLLGLIVFTNALLALVLTLTLYVSHRTATRTIDEHTQATVISLERGLTNLLDQIDLLLVGGQRVLEHELASGEFDERQVDEYIQATAPQIRGLGVFRFSNERGDVSGEVGYPANSPAISIADREYFRVLLEHDPGTLVSSKPVFGRILGEWVVAFARSYRKPNGQFAGAVYASVRLRQFAALFSSLSLGRDSAVTLVDADFALVANYPEERGTDWIGKRIAQPDLVAQMQAGKTAFPWTLTSRLDGVERRYAIRKLPYHPYWLGVGLSVEAEMRPWRQQVLGACSIMLIFTVLTSIAGLMVQRGWRRQEEMERKLVESEAQYRWISENTDDVIWSLDARTMRFTFVSPSVQKLRGYTPDEVMHQTLADVVTPESRREVQRIMEEAIASREPGQTRVVNRPTRVDQPHRDGHVVPTEAATTIIFDDGRPIEIVGVTRDITERLRAEEALKQSEEGYRRLIENSHEFIAELDPQARFLYVSPNHETILGYAAGELLGTRLDQYVLPEDVAPTNATFSQLLEAGTATLTLRFREKAGGYRWFESTGRRYVAPDGERRVLTFSHDVTGHRQTEAERLKLEEQLRMSQKMEAIGILAGGVAHDFNNLLSVILNYNEFAMSGLCTDDPRYEDLLGVRKAAERAADLTRQLLAFSRKQLWQPTTLDLNQIIEDLDKMLRRILGEDVAFERRLAPNLGAIRADRSQIEQVVMNLVVNAREAMPEGGRLTIETSRVAPSNQNPVLSTIGDFRACVQLVVTDNGHGMDEATRAQIFEPFFTTKGRGKGTGLGLATVYGIVQKCGGSISVDSTPGRGSSFTLQLPIAEAPLPQTPLRSAEPTARADRGTDRGTETLLVVEDDNDLREVVRRHLSTAGYQVLVAEDGIVALRVSAEYKGKIALVVTDVIMPLMNGRAVAEELQRQRPDIKILFMSGYTGNVLAQHGILDESIHLITKPFTASALLRKVRELLDGSDSSVPPIDNAS